MKRFGSDRSLRWHLTALASIAAVATAAGGVAALLAPASRALLETPLGEAFHLRLVLGMVVGGLLGMILALSGISRLLLPLHQFRQAFALLNSGETHDTIAGAMPCRELEQLKTSFERASRELHLARTAAADDRRALTDQSDSVSRLLAFTQSIQGAGQPEQIHTALARHIRQELSLEAALVISIDPADSPAAKLRAVDPESAVVREQIPELDAAACPCLRQHLPRTFESPHSAIRCSIDALIPQAAALPAHCIPFTVRSTTGLVHLILPADRSWDEPLRQLAAAYVSTAQSALASLTLLIEAEKQSLTDSLTGLFNRRSMEALLSREIALAERHHQALSLVMIDMDQFKQINDAHGHAAGDHLLKSFADCVRFTLRKTDLAFRFGGDEFVIVLPQTPAAMAQQVVHKLRTAFAAIDFSQAIVRLDHQPTLSMGVAERSEPLGILTHDQLLSAADSALYDAKTANRNCIRVYTPPRAA